MSARRWWVMAILSVGACGEPGEAVGLAEVVVPWEGALACTHKALVAERMRATLKIGGMPDCALTVDPATLEVSGTCSDILAGTVRPLLLIYEQERSTGGTLPVAYWVSFVNLCPSRLPTDGSADVAITFVNDNVRGTLLTDPDDVDDLPFITGGVPRPSCDDTLFEAKIWARSIITARAGTLDDDCDGQENLLEACEDTLFTDDPSLCN